MPSRPTSPPGPRSIVSGYERSLQPSRRRRSGAHYTPDAVAGAVWDLAVEALGTLPRRVCDPTCGAGAFLLTIAQRLFELGVGPEEVVRDRLVGLELDPAAAAVAREALSRWAAERGGSVDAAEVQVHVGDALVVSPQQWPARPPGGFDMVVGNPPFLSQLSRRTARSAERRRTVHERLGVVGAYADDAGLFLLGAVDLVAAGGVLAMLQPQSILSARDARSVRSGVAERCELAGLWAHGGTPFPDADVAVCAPVLRRRDDAATRSTGGVRVVWEDGGTTRRSTVDAPDPGGSWGAVLAPSLGVPEIGSLSGRRLGEVATTTAGFRDEYYALCDALAGPAGAPQDGDGDAQGGGRPRLVTVGMIDPGRLRWGTEPHRLARTRVERPTVDLDRLDREHPRAARWARARLVPKVLVATQTKVVEAVADPAGECVPLTPTISVEPTSTIDVWHLVAALSAPPVAAAVARDQAGAGRSVGALRWSARGVADMPLPIDLDEWRRGAELARAMHLDDHGPGFTASSSRPSPDRRSMLLDELGVTMTRAYGLRGDHPVASWWSARRPRR